MTQRIETVTARQILDSRGRPTVEAELHLGDGTVATASVPSGASTGRHEALELRDGDQAAYGGRGVQRAVTSVIGEIADALCGAEPVRADVDRLLIDLDGTPDKSRLGANAILAVSIACARAEAAIAGLPLWRHLAGERTPMLPLPMVNIISGGLHASRQLDFQDFLVVPIGAKTFAEALEMVVRVHAGAARVLERRGLPTLKADEGGFGPPLASHGAALDLLDTAVEAAGLSVGHEIAYALDVAATHFYDETTGEYRLPAEGRRCDVGELIDLLEELVAGRPVISIEDPLAEDDWLGWATFTGRFGSRMQVIGDDLFATNAARLEQGIEQRAGNAVLVKMNQIGTISETLAVVERAHAAGWRTVISARSGETEDSALADLAVGCAGGQIKIGSVTGSERLAKYNQLLRIEEALGQDAVFAGRDALTAPTGARRDAG
jgi:enolase